MSKSATELAERWDLTGQKSISGKTYTSIYNAIEFFNKRHYFQYIPTQGPRHSSFPERFDCWLENVSSDRDKMLLFELAPEITFFGREEFAKLYDAALVGPVTRWLVKKLKLNFGQSDFEDRLANALANTTWYCPLTDSMPISDFHHANNIGGIDFRPDFRSLAQFGDPAKVANFMSNPCVGNSRPALERIVILEDFVGSGTQVENALRFASSISTTIEVLFVPLLICPEGVRRVQRVAAKYANVEYEAVIELPDDAFINPTSNHQPTSVQAEIRSLLKSTYCLVRGNGPGPRPYGEFGFADTGSLVVLYSNTPANTLPIIQHESSNWKPIFRRSARIR